MRSHSRVITLVYSFFLLNYVNFCSASCLTTANVRKGISLCLWPCVHSCNYRLTLPCAGKLCQTHCLCSLIACYPPSSVASVHLTMSLAAVIHLACRLFVLLPTLASPSCLSTVPATGRNLSLLCRTYFAITALNSTGFFASFSC